MSGIPITAARCTCAASPPRCGSSRGIAAAAGWPRAAGRRLRSGIARDAGRRAARPRCSNGTRTRSARSIISRRATGSPPGARDGSIAVWSPTQRQNQISRAQDRQRRHAGGLVAGRQASRRDGRGGRSPGAGGGIVTTSQLRRGFFASKNFRLRRLLRLCGATTFREFYAILSRMTPHSLSISTPGSILSISRAFRSKIPANRIPCGPFA